MGLLDLDRGYLYNLPFNPYEKAIPVPSTDVVHILGGNERKRIRDEIISFIKQSSDFGLIVIQGKPQTGKTHLLLNIKYHLNKVKEPKIKVKYLRMSELNIDLNLVRQYENLKNFFGSLLRRRKYVLIVDEIDTIYSEPEFYKSLKSLIDKRPSDLILIIAITPEVLNNIYKISTPLASRIKSPNLFYDLKTPSLSEIIDIVIEYLLSFNIELNNEQMNHLKDGIRLLYEEFRIRELRDVLAVMCEVFECARSRNANLIERKDFLSAISRIRPSVRKAGSIAGLKLHDYYRISSILPPNLPPAEVSEKLRQSLIRIFHFCKQKDLLKYYYPKARKLETPGGIRNYRIADIFIVTKDDENVVIDIKVKEEDQKSLTMRELENVIDIARYSKERIDKVIVISNGTFPPDLKVPKLMLVNVDKTLFADIFYIAERIQAGDYPATGVLQELFKKIKL